MVTGRGFDTLEKILPRSELADTSQRIFDLTVRKILAARELASSRDLATR